MTANDSKKSKKIIITEEERKAYGVCEHNQVNYKTIEKFANVCFKRIKSDKKQFKILTADIQLKNNHILDLKKMNEMMVGLQQIQKELTDNENTNRTSK